MADLL